MLLQWGQVSDNVDMEIFRKYKFLRICDFSGSLEFTNFQF